jgi:hypothetical protein
VARSRQVSLQRAIVDKYLSQEFYSVAGIGGGHPKIASLLNVCGPVTVYDQYPDIYKKSHKEFVARYPMTVEVEYEKKNISHANFTPNAELAILCHILEHLTIKQIRRLLGNLETDKVLIYGPSIDKAVNEKWLHFKPKDHRTFATLEAMRTMVEDAGFRVDLEMHYVDDYVIYGVKA